MKQTLAVVKSFGSTSVQHDSLATAPFPPYSAPHMHWSGIIGRYASQQQQADNKLQTHAINIDRKPPEQMNR